MSSFPRGTCVKSLKVRFSEEIEATRDATNWSGFLNNTPYVRDVFLYWVVNAPSSYYDDYAHHSFWKLWRSKSSNSITSAFEFSVRGAKDIGWIDKIYPHVNYPLDPENITTLALSRFDAVSTLKLLEEKELLAITPSVLFHASKSCSMDTFLFLWAHPLSQNIKRVDGLEAQLLLRHSETNDMKVYLEEVWKRWGMPSSSTLHQMYKASVNRPGKRRVCGFFEDLHNPQMPSWTNKDYFVFIRAGLQHDFDRTEEYVLSKKWVVPSEVWEDVFASLHLSDEKKNRAEKLSLLHATKSMDHSSRVSRKM